MLGDALVYGFSLSVVARGPAWKARAAVAKAAVMGLFGVFVFGQVVYKLLYPQLPTVEAMGAVGVLALAANGACFALLWRHRAEDINMRSVWLCSRNDLVANGSVLSRLWSCGSRFRPGRISQLGRSSALYSCARRTSLLARCVRSLRLNHAQRPVVADAPQAARR